MIVVVVHGVLVTSVHTLVVKLGMLEVLGIHLRVVHVSLLLLAHAALTLARVLVFEHELEHFKLVFLKRAHVLHLLVVETLRLFQHAAVIRLGIVDLDLDYSLRLSFCWHRL